MVIIIFENIEKPFHKMRILVKLDGLTGPLNRSGHRSLALIETDPRLGPVRFDW